MRLVKTTEEPILHYISILLYAANYADLQTPIA